MLHQIRLAQISLAVNGVNFKGSTKQSTRKSTNIITLHLLLRSCGGKCANLAVWRILSSLTQHWRRVHVRPGLPESPRDRVQQSAEDHRGVTEAVEHRRPPPVQHQSAATRSRSAPRGSASFLTHSSDAQLPLAFACAAHTRRSAIKKPCEFPPTQTGRATLVALERFHA